jgi:hypothetical protein
MLQGRLEPMRSVAEVILRFGAIAAAALGLASHYAWGDVVSNRDGRFSIDFPGKVIESTQTVDTSAGPATAHIYQHTAGGKATYTALYSDYPPGSIAGSSVEAIYEGAINGALGKAGGTLRSSTTIEVSGVVGREAVFDAPSTKESVRVRYFLVGDRLYQVAYDGPQGSETGKDATMFLDSFKILR